MRRVAAITLLLLSLTATAEEGFQTATVLDAGAHRERNGGVFVPGGTFGAWSNTKENVNTLTLQIGDIAVTATYNTVFKNGKNSAANLIIGQTVQAQLGGRGGRKLVVRIPDGGEIRADVVRREMMALEARSNDVR